MLTPVNALERFRNIEVVHNKSFMQFLLMLQDMFIEVAPKDDHEKKQHELLETAYAVWYKKILENHKTLEACKRMHEVITPVHKLLLARDTQLLHIKGDLLSALTGVEGLDTPYLYNLMSSDPDPSRDERLAFWGNLRSMYRIAAIICIYSNNAQIREVIDLILSSNPDLSGGNMAGGIMSMMKTDKRLRRLIMNLMKKQQHKLPEIFSQLQIVLSTLVDDDKIPQPANSLAQVTPEQRQAWVSSILAGEIPDFKEWTERDQELLVQAVLDDDDMLWSAYASRVTPAQQTAIRQTYAAKKSSAGTNFKAFNDTMNDFVSAMSSNDEQQMEALMTKTTSMLNVAPEDLKDMEMQLEAEEKEWDED